MSESFDRIVMPSYELTTNPPPTPEMLEMRRRIIQTIRSEVTYEKRVSYDLFHRTPVVTYRQLGPINTITNLQ